MRVLVTGATGCVGRAVVHALRSRGHRVVEGARRGTGTPGHLPIDFMLPRAPESWARELRRLQIDVVVNCVGILVPARGQSFERIHTQGPIELFRGAALAGVGRVLQVSALGVGPDAEGLSSRYLHSKLLADDALAAIGVDWAVLRPSLVYGPHSQSAALFATLASLPVIGLPGRGLQRVQPLHVFELAEAMARLVERPGRLGEVFELGGAAALSYREMLAQYRAVLGLQAPLWLPLPMTAMRVGALCAEALPQKVFSRDTLLLLERGSVPRHNAAPTLLGREPSSLPHGLAITAPEPALDLRVRLSPAVEALLRLALALMWGALAVSALAAWNPHDGSAQVARLWTGLFSLALGLGVLLRPGAWMHALQAVALVGCTVAAGVGGAHPALEWAQALSTNLPALGVVVLLCLSAPRQPKSTPGPQQHGARSRLPQKSRA